MKFDETIFNEIKYHDVEQSHTLANDTNGPTNYALVAPLVRKSHPIEHYEPKDDYEQRIKDEMGYGLSIGVIPAHGPLATALRAYENHFEIRLHLHPLKLNNQDYLGFLTRDMGFDIIETDLLCCDWNMDSRHKFFSYINSDQYKA